MNRRPKTISQLGIGLLPVVLWFCSWTSAQDLRDPHFMSEATAAFEYVRNLDYDQAEQMFETLRSKYPEHPGPLLYLATVAWLRELFERQELDLDRFAAPAYFTKPSDKIMSQQDRKKVFGNVDRCQELAQAILTKKPTDKDARYFMGLAHGILASFSITIDRSKSRAFSHGKKAYGYHKKLVEEDPDYYDAYMSVGLYEYIVDNLPWYIKWLATIIGYHGDEEQGFEYLSLAAEKGPYSSDDARVLQMVLFVREERYEEALANARLLHAKYPRNFLLHLNRAQILDWMNHKSEAIEEYERVLERAEAGKRNYQKLPMPVFRYELAVKLMDLDRSGAALKLLQASIADPETPERQRALSHFRAAQIFDRQGKARQAVVHYERVLRLADVENSHDQARKSLQRLK